MRCCRRCRPILPLNKLSLVGTLYSAIGFSVSPDDNSGALIMAIERHHTNDRMSQLVIHGDTVFLAGQVAQGAPGGTPDPPARTGPRGFPEQTSADLLPGPQQRRRRPPARRRRSPPRRRPATAVKSRKALVPSKTSPSSPEASVEAPRRGRVPPRGCVCQHPRFRFDAARRLGWSTLTVSRADGECNDSVDGDVLSIPRFPHLLARRVAA